MKLPPPDLPAPVSLPPPSLPEGVAPALAGPAFPLNPYAPPETPVPVKEKTKEVKDAFDASQSFSSLIRESFAYPFRGQDWAVVGGSALLFFLVIVIGLIPLVAVLTLIGAFYLAAYYLDIVQHTLNGGNELPSWPELSNIWDDLVIPGVQMFVITFLSSLPQLAVGWYYPEDESSTQALLYWLCAMLKWLYFPMAVLAVICHGSLWAALPHRVLPAVVRCLPGYLLCAAGFGLAELLEGGLSAGLSEVPAFGWLLPLVTFLYFMFVQARLTGLIYLRYQERIPWGN